MAAIVPSFMATSAVNSSVAVAMRPPLTTQSYAFAIAYAPLANAFCASQ